MGSNCCRLVESSKFEPGVPQTNGYVNEGHSYTPSEHDCSKSLTINIGDLSNEDLKRLENDRVTDSLDNGTEKQSAKPDEAASNGLATYASPFPALPFSINGEVKENKGCSSETDCPLAENGSQSIHPQNIIDFHQDSVPPLTIEEPEYIQKELFQSTPENNSLTESAILDVPNGNTPIENDISPVHHNDQQHGIQCSGDSPQEHVDNHKPHPLTSNTEPCVATDGSSLVALMIQRHSLRDMKTKSSNKQVQSKVFIDYSEFDADVAEALAALDAAIAAGEDFEDD